MTQQYKLAFIVPRYACGKAGGAEIHCQEVAEHLSAKGHHVSALTTTASDHFSWKGTLKAGEETLNGVTVKRFNANKTRNTKRFLKIQQKINFRETLTESEELEWTKNSINSTDLENYIRKNKDNYDWFIFMPYLFGITYACHQICPEKSLLIPCLHEESFAYLSIFHKMFNNFKGIMFNTIPEKIFAKQLYALPDSKTTLVSLGFTPPTTVNSQNFIEKYNIDFPFILFVGRREEGKNIPLLLSYFRMYKKNNPNNLKLLFLGTGELNLTPEDKNNIIDLGFVSEEDKINANAAAMCLCQPSVNESLSIVLMESWLCKSPVLVHRNCNVTTDHCQRSNGGLYFKNYFEFEECVSYFLKNPSLTKQMGENGNQYVRKNFNWDAVTDRFHQAFQKFSH